MLVSFLKLENRHTGEILRIRRLRDASGETILTIEGSLPPGASGPPLHIHFQEREEIIVKAGTAAARIGNKKIVAPAGSEIVFPAGVPHKWWNAGNDLLELSGRVVPAADLDRYLQAVIAVINASSSGRPSLFYLAHVAWRHRDTQTVLLLPPVLQRILFPLILAIGRRLGKYRGDSWPGCPASCPGAPSVETAAY